MASQHMTSLPTTPSALQLLQHGADINSLGRRPDGGTALHEAVAYGHALLVSHLMASGANPFVGNIEGLSAVDIAVKHKRSDCMRLLEHAALFSGEVAARAELLAAGPAVVHSSCHIPRLTSQS